MSQLSLLLSKTARMAQEVVGTGGGGDTLCFASEGGVSVAVCCWRWRHLPYLAQIGLGFIVVGGVGVGDGIEASAVVVGGMEVEGETVVVGEAVGVVVSWESSAVVFVSGEASVVVVCRRWRHLPNLSQIGLAFIVGVVRSAVVAGALAEAGGEVVVVAGVVVVVAVIVVVVGGGLCLAKYCVSSDSVTGGALAVICWVGPTHPS